MLVFQTPQRRRLARLEWILLAAAALLYLARLL